MVILLMGELDIVQELEQKAKLAVLALSVRD